MEEIINIHTHNGTARTYEIKKGWVYIHHSEKPMKFLFKTNKGFKIANWKFAVHLCLHNPRGAKVHMLIRNPLFQLDKHNWGFNLTVGKCEIMYNQL